MKRDLALQVLKDEVEPRDIVVAVYQALFDWMAINPRDLNYMSTGAMGLGSSHGLGLALANPDRRVLVLDGDGSLLMSMGSLATIGAAAPANYYHFVFSNGVYEVNGSHPVPGGGSVDFARIAQSCGYRSVMSSTSLNHFRDEIAGFVSRPGPALADLKVEPGEPYSRDYPYIHSAEARARFRSALNSN